MSVSHEWSRESHLLQSRSKQVPCHPLFDVDHIPSFHQPVSASKLFKPIAVSVETQEERSLLQGERRQRNQIASHIKIESKTPTTSISHLTKSDSVQPLLSDCLHRHSITVRGYHVNGQTATTRATDNSLPKNIKASKVNNNVNGTLETEPNI